MGLKILDVWRELNVFILLGLNNPYIWRPDFFGNLIHVNPAKKHNIPERQITLRNNAIRSKNVIFMQAIQHRKSLIISGSFSNTMVLKSLTLRNILWIRIWLYTIVQLRSLVLLNNTQLTQAFHEQNITMYNPGYVVSRVYFQSDIMLAWSTKPYGT